MGDLVIAEVGIRRDEQGRFCLNDLHRAAVANGANPRTKEPRKFFASPQTAELVTELTDTQDLGIGPVNVIKGGNFQGTFVCKELVYAYAMWISPKFHLQVIRAYDAMATAPPKLDPLDALNDPASMRTLLLNYSEKVIERDKLIAMMAPKVEALTRISEMEGSLCITNAAKTLQIPPKRLFHWLQSNRWVYRRQGKSYLIAYQERINADLLTHKITTFYSGDGEERIRSQVRITAKGMAALAEVFCRGELRLCA